MPSLKSYNAPIPQPVNQRLQLPGDFPLLPDAVLKRFPDTEDYNDAAGKFWKKVQRVLVDNTQELASAQNQTKEDSKNLSATFTTATAELTARIIHEETVRADADGALASSITAVIASYTAADAIISAAVVTESTARASADGALASNITSVIAAYTAADAVISASVTTEAAARATSDGYLAGSYVIRVGAGNIVAGMAITAISNPATWTTTSEISFQATVFKIYDGSSSVAPFVVTGGTVYMQNAVVNGTLNIGSSNNQVFTNGSGLSIAGGQITAGSYAGLAVLSIAGGSGALRMYANPGGGGFPPSLSSDSGQLAITADGFIRGSHLVSDGALEVNGGHLTIGGAGHNLVLNDGVVMKAAPGGWGPYLWDGSNLIELQFDGSNVNARINGGTVIVLG